MVVVIPALPVGTVASRASAFPASPPPWLSLHIQDVSFTKHEPVLLTDRPLFAFIQKTLACVLREQQMAYGGNAQNMSISPIWKAEWSHSVPPRNMVQGPGSSPGPFWISPAFTGSPVLGKPPAEPPPMAVNNRHSRFMR